MDTNKTFSDMLSTRSINGLIGCFGDGDIINQPERIAAGRDRLTLARNIGPKSLREIALALNEFSYIDDIEKWLRGLKDSTRGKYG
jgi:hypothetical protein